MLRLRLAGPPLIRFRYGVSAAVVPAPASAPLPIAIVIGPRGEDGDPGEPGPPGPAIGGYDPGDVTLDFLNALI